MKIITLIIALFAFLGCGGYVSNIMWLLNHFDRFTPEFLWAIVGVFAVPLGIIHGLYIWTI